jgi:hypothetical protein
MGEVIVVENAMIIVKLVVHKILHADVIVLYTADPKVIMA